MAAITICVCQQIWKTQQWPQDWKRSFFIPIPKKGNAKESSSYCTIAFISHNSKVNFLMFKLVLEKAEEPEIKLPTSTGSWKKQESSRKTSISALLTMPKPLTVWITINCGKFWNRWEYQTTWPASWEICIQVRKQQLELDMERWIGSKLRKEYVKVVYCHLAYLTYIQSTSMWNATLEEAQAGIKIAGRNINNEDMQMTPTL